MKITLSKDERENLLKKLDITNTQLKDWLSRQSYNLEMMVREDFASDEEE